MRIIIKHSEEVRNVRLKLNLQYNFICILALLFICLTTSSALINISYASDSSAKNKQEGQIQKADYEFKIADNKKRFQSTEKMNYNHIRHISILLPDGNVLIRDGKKAEIFYPETNKYVVISEEQKSMCRPFLTGYQKGIMKDGNALMIGDYDVYELFDYRTKTFKEFDTSSFPHSLKNLRSIKIISPDYIFLKYSFLIKDKDKNTVNNEYYLYNYLNKKSIKLDEKLFLTYMRTNETVSKIFFQDDNNLIFILPHGERYGINYNVLRYSMKDNKYEFLLKYFVSNAKGSYYYKEENKIYIFSGETKIDSVKKRENTLYYPIYMVDLNTKEFSEIGSLWGSGAEENIQLKDGRIMFNSGKSYGERVQHEIYDPKTNKSTFTASYPWHRGGTAMTLLNDGSVLINGGYVNWSSKTYHGSKDSYRYYPKYKKADEN